MSANDTITVVQPTAGQVKPHLVEAWKSRELFLFLTLRDVKIRYVQTKLGWLWTIANPLGMMLVFSFAFRQLGNVQSDGVKYSIFALTGLAFWVFFSRAVLYAADSLVINSPLLTKTSCPRLLMPLAAVAAVLFDLAITVVLAFVFATLAGYPPTWHIIFAPLALLLGIVFTMAVGLFLSAINVRYHDVRNGVPIVVQVLVFVSPVAYSLSTLGPRAETLLAINPLVGIIEAFRWTLLPTPPPSAMALGFAIGITALLAVGGLVYFSRFAREFADVA
jgi:lipopolysaccharide transport system permease protein